MRGQVNIDFGIAMMIFGIAILMATQHVFDVLVPAQAELRTADLRSVGYYVSTHLLINPGDPPAWDKLVRKYPKYEPRMIGLCKYYSKTICVLSDDPKIIDSIASLGFDYVRISPTGLADKPPEFIEKKLDDYLVYVIGPGIGKSENMISALRKLVGEGRIIYGEGALVFWPYEARREPIPPRMQQLFGVYIGGEVYRTATFTPPRGERHPILGDIDVSAITLDPPGRYCIAKNATVVLEAATKLGERFPGLTINRFGNGIAIYSSYPLLSLYAQRKSAILGDLLREILEFMVQPKPASYVIPVEKIEALNVLDYDIVRYRMGLRDYHFKIRIYKIWTGEKILEYPENVEPVENALAITRIISLEVPGREPDTRRRIPARMEFIIW